MGIEFATEAEVVLKTRSYGDAAISPLKERSRFSLLLCWESPVVGQPLSNGIRFISRGERLSCKRASLLGTVGELKSRKLSVNLPVLRFSGGTEKFITDHDGLRLISHGVTRRQTESRTEQSTIS